jgi:hypothetical protein
MGGMLYSTAPPTRQRSYGHPGFKIDSRPQRNFGGRATLAQRIPERMIHSGTVTARIDQNERRHLTKAQILELISHAVELELGQELEVKYDARIPEILTGNLRQVDSAIITTGSGRQFLRIVEVQDRSSRMGAQFVDLATAKARSVGAHRLTLVAAAGFTRGAIDKIRQEHSAIVDAIELRQARPDEWPQLINMRSVTVKILDEAIKCELLHRRYVDALSRRVVFDVLYGSVRHYLMSQVLCFLIDPNKPPPGLVSSFFLGNASRHVRDVTLEVGYTESDGRQARLEVTATPDPI